MMYRHIVFEGGDGSGKTVQSNMTAKNLEDVGYDVFWTKEPTDSDIGLKIRRILKGDEKVDRRTLLNLFYQDRKQHIDTVIEPSLKIHSNTVVIQDRSYYSTMAYQQAQGIPQNEILHVHNQYKPKKADVVMLIDVNVDTAMRRIAERSGSKDIFEKEEFQRKVYNVYQRMNSIFRGENIQKINGIGSEEAVQNRILNALDGYLPNSSSLENLNL